MKLLILGGTKFLGRYLVDTALTRGHDVTLFNRGQTNADVYPEVNRLLGNRDGQMEALYGTRFDAVIDTSGYLPRVVRQSVELLAGLVQHYTFISSISVYEDFSQNGIYENSKVADLEDESSEDITQFYGSLKARCEQEVQSVFGDRALIVRPGLIVGPYDPTDRFTYWVHRFAQGGNVLLPERREKPVQWIDARDLAEWILSMVEQKVSGIFNATGVPNAFTFADMVEKLEQSIPTSTTPIWVSEEFLLAHDVGEWMELPLWISDKTNWPGFMTADVSSALNSGLTLRPMEQTILDTLEWDHTRPQDITRQAGLNAEREAELLKLWHDQTAG